MPTKTLETSWATIKVAGTALSDEVADSLMHLEVEHTYNRPACALLTLNAPPNAPLPAALELGKEFEVAFRKGNTPTVVFRGEITALEFDFVEHTSVFIVQAEDKFHRFFRGDRLKPYLKKTIDGVASDMAKEVGVPVGKIESTKAELPLQLQANMSHGAWLLERAGELGFHAGVVDGKFFFGKVGAGGDSGVKLTLGDSLLSFNARITANATAKDATVRSWDTKSKKEIVGKATSYGGIKDDKVDGAFTVKPSILLSRTDLGSPAEANATAQAALDRANEINRQAEGRCFGEAKLALDKEVDVAGVNSRFNGKYRVSRVRHTYSHDEGFMTEFSCRGLSDQSLSGLVSETAASTGTGPDRSVFDGVTVGVVSDIKDPENLGRVVVELPALGVKPDGKPVTTDWIRMAMPGGGGSPHHGWFLLPDVRDEVLVAFEQGDVRRAYVIGGLLNGVDKPGKPVEGAHKDGKTEKHAFLLRSGAHLLFDENAGEEKFEIKNKDGNFLFKYSSKEGVLLENKSSGDKFAINNKGNLTIVSETGDITIEAKAGGITLKAMKDVNIDATGKVGIKATQDASVEGMNAKITGQMNAEVKGNIQGKLEGGATAVVKGAMVMIN